MEKLNKEIKLETWFEATAITEIIEELEMAKLNDSKEHLQTLN